MEFIEKENRKKKKFTKSKNEIKENLKQKICPLTFCTPSSITLTIRFQSSNVF